MLKCNWALVGKVGWTCSTGWGTSLTAWLSKELEVRLKVPLPMLGPWPKPRAFFYVLLRLTGRLAVIFITVKPFTDEVAASNL